MRTFQTTLRNDTPNIDAMRFKIVYRSIVVTHEWLSPISIYEANFRIIPKPQLYKASFSTGSPMVLLQFIREGFPLIFTSKSQHML